RTSPRRTPPSWTTTSRARRRRKGSKVPVCCRGRPRRRCCSSPRPDEAFPAPVGLAAATAGARPCPAQLSPKVAIFPRSFLFGWHHGGRAICFVNFDPGPSSTSLAPPTDTSALCVTRVAGLCGERPRPLWRDVRLNGKMKSSSKCFCL
ncbi:hypothetical protein FOCC_FOCC006256, partial [Frankliniella occidentalis]